MKNSVNKAVITINDTLSAINALKEGKACGIDGLKSECFKYASYKVLVVVSLSLSTCLKHGHLSNSMLDFVLEPIVKKKGADA